LVLPGWLNWLTANIGYHHVHHLSAAIPGYALARCHEQYQHLFTTVRRIRLHEIPAHLKCLQWDIDRQQIIAVNDQQRSRQRAAFRQSAS
jgi:omega-6 fatty acid desaturase (delta-12 desaturase)